MGLVEGEGMVVVVVGGVEGLRMRRSWREVVWGRRLRAEETAEVAKVASEEVASVVRRLWAGGR